MNNIFFDQLRFHVFGIGQRSLGFSVQIQVKTGSKISVIFYFVWGSISLYFIHTSWKQMHCMLGKTKLWYI